jgi:hypothetical protein
MLGHIFYFIGLFLFFLNLSKITSYFKFINTKEWTIKFKKVTGKDPLKSDFRDEKEHKLFVYFGCLSVIETIWLICGLLSSSWQIFGITILLGVIIKQIFDKSPFSVQKIIGFVFNVFRSGVIILLVLNHFHFHQNLTKWIFIWI